MARKIFRGDSYAIRRPLYTYTFQDEDLDPLSLNGCTIQITYKPSITTIESDSLDSTAVIKHEIKINGGGTVVSQTGLYLVGAATGGVIQERLTKVETAALPVDVELVGDLQLTDENGEVVTWLFDEKLMAVDGVTHRPPS